MMRSGVAGVVVVLAAVAMAGGAGKVTPKTAGGSTPSPAATATQPAAGSSAGDLMAYINGKPVTMEPLYDILVRGYGLPVAQQVVATELAEQAARKKGISLTEAEAQAEHDLTLHQTFPKAESNDQREQMLDQLLSQRNVSRGQWNLIMRRNALLRKMVPAEIPVSPEEIREEFGRLYDRQVVVRHIETSSLADAQKILARAAKEDFALLAQKNSINASGAGGGLLPPIGKNTPQVSPALRQAALALKKVGDLSDPIQTGTTFHILKLERIIEPQDVKFEDVKDKIAAAIREAKTRICQNQILQQLVAEAKIEYVNPVLKMQAERAAKGSAGE